MTRPGHISSAEYRELLAKPKRANKFNAVRTQVDGIWFDSKAEADRYSSLKLLERARVISGLGLQPVFALMGPKGKPVAAYRADFCFFENGRRVVEDVKGVMTAAFRLKAKMFLQQYPDHELRLVDGAGKRITFTMRSMKVAA